MGCRRAEIRLDLIQLNSNDDPATARDLAGDRFGGRLNAYSLL